AALGIRTLDDLKAAAESGRLAEVRGFGPGRARKLLAAIAALDDRAERFLLHRALDEATALREHLRRACHVERVEIAGAVRRSLETVDGIELLAAAAHAAP